MNKMFFEKRRLKAREKASVPREGKRAAKQQGSSGKAAAKTRSRVSYENKSLTESIGNLCTQSIFVAGNATNKSMCRSGRRSVGPSVRRSVGPSHFTFFEFLSSLKVEKFRYGFFMDISAPAQIVTAPAQLITAPAQPPATGVIVTSCIRPCLSQTLTCKKHGPTFADEATANDAYFSAVFHNDC